MKAIILIFSAILLCIGVAFAQPFTDCNDIIIGNGTATSYEIPINTIYNYSYTQQIYEASEIEFFGENTTLTAISFQYVHSTPYYNKIEQTIYLGITDKAVFESTNDWIPLSQLQEVFYGTLDYNNNNEWYTIPLHTPFEYSGGNIVVAVLNNSGNYISITQPTFECQNITGKTLHYRVDGSFINPANPPTATGILAERNNIQFHICGTPSILPDYTLNPNNIIGEGAEITLVPDPIPHGGTGTVYFTTTRGCAYIADVIIADEHYGPISSYQFVNVTAPLPLIEVVTAMYQYEITANYFVNGNMESTGGAMVNCGDCFSISFMPSDCYEIEKVLVDGVENMQAIQNGCFTFMSIMGDHTIQIFFKIKTFNIEATVVGDGGSIDPSGISEINCGEDITYTITPDEGYKISHVLVNGDDMGTINTYTFAAIEADGSIEVLFSLIPPLDITNPTLDGISIYSHTNVVYIVNKKQLPISDVTIFDMYGRTVWQGKVVENKITLDVANGIYTVRLSSEDQFTTTKVSISGI